MWKFACIVVLCLPTTSYGKQTKFDLVRGDAEFEYTYRWKDANGEKHKLAFDLPISVATSDRGEETYVVRQELAVFQAQAVRIYAKTLPKRVTLRAKADGPSLGLTAGGPKKEAKAALKEAEIVAEDARTRWMATQQVTQLKGGGLIHDHARLVGDYAGSLSNVATALSADAKGTRDYVSLALSFVQSIPYEAQKKKGGNPGYRRPLALLNRNKGDCDSKSVLFLSLVHAQYPNLDLAVIYVPGHALTGIALPAEKGDRSFKIDGTEFIYAEPVGPAMMALGETAPANKKAGKKGEVRMVQ